MRAAVQKFASADKSTNGAVTFYWCIYFFAAAKTTTTKNRMNKSVRFTDFDVAANRETFHLTVPGI